MGDIPVPGLLIVKFFFVNLSLFLISKLATIEFLATFKFFFSLCDGFFLSLPKIISTFLTWLIKFFNSFSVILAL